jgi:hypothetical protein
MASWDTSIVYSRKMIGDMKGGLRESTAFEEERLID